MDNLTHTLIGVLVGETVHTVAPSNASGLTENQRRNLFLPMMVVGSNLPDLDFLYSTFTGNKLDYLLEHRGHSHTVVGAVLTGLLLLAACELWMRIAKRTPTRSDRRWLAVAALLGPLLHIAMDGTNSYGVHPFWPVHNGWLYGDAVFIIEPALWIAAAPLTFRLRTVVARVLVALVLFAGIALSVTTGLVPRPFTAVLAVLTAILLAIGWRAGAKTSLLAGVALWLSLSVTFLVASAVAHRRVEELATQSLPQWHTLDVILTPMPANPACWSTILVQSQDGHYALRRAMLSLAPGWLAASNCPVRNPTLKITAPLTANMPADSDAIVWHGELTMERSAFAQLVRKHCEAAGLMKFARAPFIVLREGQWIIGDLRFDGEPGLSFAEFALDENRPRCPAYVPPWTEPRLDLLNGTPKPVGESP